MEIFSTKDSGRYGSDTYGQTDGRTYIHGGKNNICLPQGETYNTNAGWQGRNNPYLCMPNCNRVAFISNFICVE